MESNLKHKTVIGLFWKLFERGGSAAVALVVQIVMARLLAPDDFGALAVMLVFVNVGNVIVRSGLNTALVQSPDTDDTDFTTVFWMSLAISVVLYAIISATAPAIAEFYGSEHLSWPLRILSAILIINAYNSVQVAYIERFMEFRKTFVAAMTSIAVSGVLGIGAALNGAGLWALVIQQVSYQITNCIALSAQVPWKPSFAFSRDRAKKLFGFGWKLLASGLLDTGYNSISDLIIGKQFSTIQLGFVSQGKKYPGAIGQMLDGAIQPIMLSAVARIQDDIPYVKRLVRRALKTSTYLVMFCMTLFALVAEPTVRLLLGEQWVPCVWFLQVYCFVYALFPIHTTNLQALKGMGRSDVFLKLEIIKKCYGLSLILFGAFVLNDVYWMVGLSMLSSVISTFVNAFPNKRVIGYSYLEQLLDIGPGVILSLVSAAIAWPISMAGLPDLITIVFQTTIMLAAYVGLSKLFHVEAFDYLITTVQEIAIRNEADESSGAKAFDNRNS